MQNEKNYMKGIVSLTCNTTTQKCRLHHVEDKSPRENKVEEQDTFNILVGDMLIQIVKPYGQTLTNNIIKSTNHKLLRDYDPV